MKRTTVYLEEPTDLKLTRLAKQQGRSKAELIREVLGEHVEEAEKKPFEVPDWVGIASSEGAYTAEEDEALLGRLIEEDYERVMKEWNAHEQDDSADSR